MNLHSQAHAHTHTQTRVIHCSHAHITHTRAVECVSIYMRQRMPHIRACTHLQEHMHRPACNNTIHSRAHEYSTCTNMQTHAHPPVCTHTCAHTHTVHTCTCALQHISPHTNPRTFLQVPLLRWSPPSHSPSLPSTQQTTISLCHPPAHHIPAHNHPRIHLQYAAILVQWRENPCRRRSGIADWMRAKDWEQSREALMVEFMLPWTKSPSGPLQ